MDKLLRPWEVKSGVILMCAVTMLIFGGVLSQFPVLPQVAQGNKDKNATVSSDTGGVMPLGYVEAARPIRDPFTVPEEFQPAGQLRANDIKEKTVVKSEPSNVSRQPRSKVPELIGVIRGNERQAVILKFGEESRTCQIGQQIGGFTVLSVEASAVVLNGPTGNITVRLKGDL